MATWFRYRLAESYPRLLFFRNAQVELEIVPEDGIQWQTWALRARKREVGGTSIELASTRYGRDYLMSVVLHKDGFCLQEDSPAAKLLDHLVQRGFAVRERVP